MNHAIQVRGLKKSYGGNIVLGGLDFEIEKGETFALLGVNGAGKTTALECIEGLRKYDSGTITVNGKMGIQLQSSSLPAHIKPMEAVRLFSKWNKAKIDFTMLNALGIQETTKKQYIQLSTGQKGDCILPLHLLVIQILFFLMSPLLGLMLRVGFHFTGKFANSSHKGKRLFWQATIWQKWKTYVTALQF